MPFNLEREAREFTTFAACAARDATLSQREAEAAHESALASMRRWEERQQLSLERDRQQARIRLNGRSAGVESAAKVRTSTDVG